MNLNVFIQRPKTNSLKIKKEDLLKFVSNQFKQLAKKNLRINIQLYNL